jgi:D-Tyr-tRNAtyr deacylase
LLKNGLNQHPLFYAQNHAFLQLMINLGDQLVNYFADQLRSFGIPTQQGEFAAHMMVSLVNDGPVTIWIEN